MIFWATMIIFGAISERTTFRENRVDLGEFQASSFVKLNARVFQSYPDNFLQICVGLSLPINRVVSL